MALRILIVEDEDRSLKDTIAILESVVDDLQVVVALSRDDAITTLEQEDFDLIICDLRIPTTTNDLDVDETHGLAVHAAAQECCPGTPLIFLTAFATPRNIRQQLSTGMVADFYGREAAPLVQLAIKDDPTECADLVAEFVSGLLSLESCAVECDDPVDPLLVRATQVYAKRVNAVRAKLSLSGGLSSAQVAQAIFHDRQGQTRSILIKLQGRKDALAEISNYNRNVPNKLQPGYFAPSVEPALHGLRKMAALYYTIANQHLSVFKVLAEDPARAARIVTAIEEAHQPWTTETRQEEILVADLRRQRVSDSIIMEHASALGPSFQVEDLVVSMDRCTSHGDLHGENILVDSADRPTLIDYGDVGLANAALDPLTLELSLIFHTAGPARVTDWPTSAQLERWADLEVYIEDSPFTQFVSRCRSWALTIAQPETVYATAYVHAVRQLKYGDVPPAHAIAVARSAADALLCLRAGTTDE